MVFRLHAEIVKVSVIMRTMFTSCGNVQNIETPIKYSEGDTNTTMT